MCKSGKIGGVKGDGTSLGIILKTNSGAKRFYERFTKETDCEIQLISLESTNFTKGISITSIQMSKGLEFDEVIIPDVREETYQTEYERSLLYVACTRAMHRLTLLYTGKPSSFIPKSIK